MQSDILIIEVYRKIIWKNCIFLDIILYYKFRLRVRPSVTYNVELINK